MANPSQFEMHTLHSPPTSPQQGAGGFQSISAPSPSTPQHSGPQPSGAEYTHQQTHPALALPPLPGTEPPYTSQPSSPLFPPTHNGQPDFFGGAGGGSGSGGMGMGMGMMNFPPPPTHAQQNQQYFPPPPTQALNDAHGAGAGGVGGQHDSPTFEPPPAPPKTPVYTPGGMAGPNGAGVHAPGQIAHPNQHGVEREKYKHTKWACFSEIGICCTGFFCPCIVYSRTYHRIKTIPNSNLNAFSACNPHCIGFCVLGPFSWVFTLLQRTRIRENYRLEGSIGSDCLNAYCCSCCTLIQDEREVRDREDERRKFAGPGNGAVGSVEGYKKPDTMDYGR